MPIRLPYSFALLLLVGILPFPRPAVAQKQGGPILSPHESRLEEVTLTALGATSAALVLPLDARVRKWATRTSLDEAFLIRRMDAVFTPLGGRLPLLVSGAAFVAGGATGHEGLFRYGLTGIEAQLATSLVDGVVKRVVGRARPNQPSHDPRDVRLGRGVEDRRYRSFPSGHAANAFTFATVLAEVLREGWPRGAPWVAGITFPAASLTSVTRLTEDEHWLSDIVAGAALGAVMGSVVADLNGY